MDSAAVHIRFASDSLMAQRIAWLPLVIMLRAFGGLEVKGLEHLRGVGTPAILASNHANELDAPALVASLPFFSRHLPLLFVSRDKRFYDGMGWRRHFYGGWIFRLIGAKEAYAGRGNYGEALVHHLDALRNGRSVCIFPWGTRSSFERAPQAKGGASFLAYASEVPILPVRIDGTAGVSPLAFLMRRHRITVTIGAPLHWKDLWQQDSAPIASQERNDFEAASARLMERVRLL